MTGPRSDPEPRAGRGEPQASSAASGGSARLSLSAAEVEEARVLLGRLLDMVEAGELEADAAFRGALVGALTALRQF